MSKLKIDIVQDTAQSPVPKIPWNQLAMDLIYTLKR
jgi:hypothetical protein